ncbi:MAG: alpha-L-fucosidase [Planctomycetota bacterium]
MTDPQSAERIASYENKAFGLFLHYGLYSLLGRGEWVMEHGRVPAVEYARLTEQFTAESFDADAIVRCASGAGMRYVCLTTRHHDGFSLYDTRGLNTYDAPHSAAGRDLIAEFSQACDHYGIGKFFYHTTLDWWHPAFDGDWDAYQRYLRDSIAILCSEYGRVDGFWFDGNWSRRERDWQEDALYGVIRDKQPEAIIVNNSSHGHHGEASHRECDVVTFEQGRPFAREQSQRYRAGEMCETMNSHWGVGAFDLSYKSPGQIIERLAACRRFQANLLLNIGPTAAGAIPELEAAVLDQVGRWIAMCPEAVYDARPTELRCGGEDFVLCHGANYYYFCHNLPITGNRHLLRGRPGDGIQGIAGALPLVWRVVWADAPEQELAFTQNVERGLFSFDATAHPYGSQLVVRIARIET